MTVGQTHQLGKIVGPSDANVVWHSRNGNVAKVENGKITALSPGTTVIWIEVSKFEVTETAAFTLTVEPFAISNIPAGNKLMLNQSHKLTVNVSQSVQWTSSDATVATINNNGVITTLSEGVTTITAKANNREVKFDLTVVDIPEIFQELVSKKLINMNDIKYTPDGFFLCTKSIGSILISAGIDYLTGYNEETKQDKAHACSLYYDDYYIFALYGSGLEDEGVLLMREQEKDGGDSDTAKVTIPFISFSYSIFLSLISNRVEYERIFMREINTLFFDKDQKHSDELYYYFLSHPSDGPYLIAEEYIKKIVANVKNGKVGVSSNLRSVLDNPNDTRIKDRLQYINQKAGYQIYSNLSINIKSPTNLTLLEKQAILTAYTGNVTFNSFASEVQYHAYSLIPPGSWLAYERAIRADLAVQSVDFYSSLINPYYDLNSEGVKSQIRYHGEY